MRIKVYYSATVDMWAVDYGSRIEYYSSETAAYRAAYGI